MTACATVVIAAVLAACSGRTVTARERALGQLPSEAQLVAAAGGPALASPTFRRLVDVARPHAPAKLGCVIDAALTSDAVGVAVVPNAGTTIVIITHAVVANCAALSRIASDTFVATIGNGGVVDTAKSVRVDPRWARARQYLVHDPLAIAVHDDTRDVLAVAQPSPVAAWVTIDAVDPDPIERDVRALIARWHTTKLELKRDSHQLIVRASKLDEDELVTMVTDLLHVADAPAAPAAAAPFVCPPAGQGITSCKDGTRYTVTSVADTLRTLSNVAATPVIESGDVIGIQLGADAGALLRRGDVIVGLDSQRITNAFQLRDLARHVGDHAALAVRRGSSDAVIELRE